MKKSSQYLLISLLWLVSTGIWIAHLCVDFYYGFTPAGIVLLHGVCVLASFAAAVAQFVRYRRAKAEEKEI